MGRPRVPEDDTSPRQVIPTPTHGDPERTFTIQSASAALREVVFQALGGVSMCWDPAPEGAFDSVRAKRIGDELIRYIETGERPGWHRERSAAELQEEQNRRALGHYVTITIYDEATHRTLVFPHFKGELNFGHDVIEREPAFDGHRHYRSLATGHLRIEGRVE